MAHIKFTNKWKPHPILLGFLTAYAILIAIGSIWQFGYINADFVGYVTITHRILDHAPWINGYWSPLYSWCMLPLVGSGVDDLIAGRMVLIASGLGYLLGIYGIATRFLDGNSRWDSALLVGVMSCGTLQAAVWGSSMLDPDLLADALLFGCFFVLLNPRRSRKWGTAFAGGLLAGLAFLGKAYFLPYLLILGPATLFLHAITDWQNHSTGEHAARLRNWLMGCLFFVLGVALIGGPWIAVLSDHYHRATFSTAGSSNHANVSPENFGHDPLWNPGLVADFMSDPHLTGDWSAFQDAEHFKHQAKVFLHNTLNCLGQIGGWLMLGVSAFGMAIWRRSCNRQPNMWTTLGHLWCVVAVALYCSGYCLINLESRYIAPVASPLLCLAALLLIRASFGETISSSVTQSVRQKEMWWAGLLLVLPFSIQDLYRYDRAAFHHMGCVEIQTFSTIAARMTELPSGPIASSEFHKGTFQAYAGKNLSNYLGAPLPTDSQGIMEQLRKSGARMYLRWIDPHAPSAMEGFVPAAPWILQLTLDEQDSAKAPSLITQRLEIYTLQKHAVTGDTP